MVYRLLVVVLLSAAALVAVGIVGFVSAQIVSGWLS